MKRVFHVALAAALVGVGASACSMPTSGPSTVPAQTQTQTQTQTSAAQQRVRHLVTDDGGRSTQNVIGSAPGFKLQVALFDAPLAGVKSASFNLALFGVDAIGQNGDSWQTIVYPAPKLVDVLHYQTSSADLGTSVLTPGSYTGLDLLVDVKDTTAMVDGVAYPVVFDYPSPPWWAPFANDISIIYVPVQIQSAANGTVATTLDFNLFQSADLHDGAVHVTPTVAGAVGRQSITGRVVNLASKAVTLATVTATDASGKVANTSITGADGSFEIHALAAGTYTVSVQNQARTNAGVLVTAVGADATPGAPVTITVKANASANVGTLKD